MSLADAKRVPMDVFAAMLELHRRERTWHELPIAQLTTLTANLYRDRKKNKRAFKVQELMFFPPEEPIEEKRPERPADPLVGIRAIDAVAAVMAARQKPKQLPTYRHRAEPEDE